jgi:hypothetical protein
MLDARLILLMISRETNHESHEHVHLLIQSGVQDQIVGHLDTVGFHRMVRLGGQQTISTSDSEHLPIIPCLFFKY